MPDPIPSGATPGWRIRPSDVAWEQFPDPHGRPTSPVRILKHDDPYVLEADFPAEFRAGMHWHPHDTIYVITAGALRFGDEGWFRPGDLRWVRGGHAYGPETAGPEGVRFFLISLGGPVGLHWADLYEVPEPVRARRDGYATLAGRLAVGAADQPWPAPAPVAGILADPIHAGDPWILRLCVAAGARLPVHSWTGDTLAYVRSGELEVGGEAPLKQGDLRWQAAGMPQAAAHAGPDGADLLLIGTRGYPDFVALD